MLQLSLKPTHKPVKAYYDTLARFHAIGVAHETAVRSAFFSLLESCGRQFDLTLVPEWQMKRGKNQRIIVDGALVDTDHLTHGFWEAKDSQDDLKREIDKKFSAGYPRDNILFQAPERAILWQNDSQVLDADLTQVEQLISTLTALLEYRPPDYVEWETAVAEFKDRVPDLARGLVGLIERERQTNTRFLQAFTGFMEKCRQSINPNLSEQAVLEMLIQHLLTERIFRKVFNNPDFTSRNAIAHEIEQVIYALTSQSFNRDDFTKSLDRFYVAIERRAATIDDFSQKQYFLNTVYERFFQGYSVKVADTHGIVYTPQPIVTFMVKSVEDILQKEFGRSLSDKDVHIIDPFVGTGNFIVHVMQEIKRTALPHKYAHELHCNEVMLLPYYIASMNIEHEYFEATGHYQPFEGICLMDTFDLAEDRQLSLLVEENTARVGKQKRTPMFVIIGNPPYNMGQVNENDNNKNRKYETMDKRISETYAKDSQATLLNKLSDPYVKAIRWASDRIGEEGIVAFVTNNSFINGFAFDGMRKHLEKDFSAIYLLDLGGNVRKNTKSIKNTPQVSNVFDIKVGVSINFFVKNGDLSRTKTANIFYAQVEETGRQEDKLRFLDEAQHRSNVEWRPIKPDRKNTWLTEGMSKDFATFISMGTKETKSSSTVDVQAIFKLFSLGVSTNRDSVLYDFERSTLESRIKRFSDDYNAEAARYQQKGRPADVDNFVDYEKIQWSSTLKSHLKRGTLAQFDNAKIRTSLYRPFTQMFLYYDSVLNDRPAHFQRIFPLPATEAENRVICLTDKGSEKPFMVLVSNPVTDLHVVSPGCGAQCFPFYTYNEDGSNRRENITDWSLAHFRNHYQDETIGKWDIFHYVYAMLHHPDYRERYQANLKRELPRIPFAQDPSTSLRASFWAFANAGERLAEIHVHYEEQPEYPLKMVETPDQRLDWRVEKMRLSKDKTQLRYNDFLTLDGIPSEAFDYRLGNRSALDWVIDQYQVKTDPRSGIVNDPNRQDDPEYIVRLIGQVMRVSLETVRIVKALSDLGIPSEG